MTQAMAQSPSQDGLVSQIPPGLRHAQGEASFSLKFAKQTHQGQDLSVMCATGRPTIVFHTLTRFGNDAWISMAQ